MDGTSFPNTETTNAVITIIGGTGDLAVRRIVPALYQLWMDGSLGPRSRIVGMARRSMSQEAYREFLMEACSTKPGFSRAAWTRFARRIHYLQGDASDHNAYKALRDAHYPSDKTNGLFYLACVPDRFGDAAAGLSAAGLAGYRSTALGFRRLAVEKPFGTNLASARALNRLLHERYAESDIFRVDHYLGKDSVQNLLYFRFANAIFEPIWNRQYIERVEIAVSETGGIGQRGSFYDDTGAARDMLQSHLMQLLCLTAMERPVDLSQDAVREEKVRLLKAVPRYEGGLPVLDSIRGQYRENPELGLKGYHDEPYVRPLSNTETFAALRLSIDSWRWAGVPFILSTGKAMDAHKAEITVVFRPTALNSTGQDSDANRLTLRIQPDEGVRIGLNVKAQGNDSSTADQLSGLFRRAPGDTQAKDAYVRLLGDALAGNSTLFIRFDETEEAWRILEPILKAWSEQPSTGLVPYLAGSCGPTLDSLRRAEEPEAIAKAASA